ncbi:MAG: helix-turn-helix transcriptional regulator [Acholeplasma sp.]|jgi:transcriptional regulator with XRE-family HTH domain|nr:helix-turn-helix transcriptional regulator [Acholeplasma sp.]
MNCKVNIDRAQTGERLRIVFAKNGITYEEVADMLGLTSPRVVYEWITGSKLPSLVNLISLSIHLGFKLEDVLVI